MLPYGLIHLRVLAIVYKLKDIKVEVKGQKIRSSKTKEIKSRVQIKRFQVIRPEPKLKDKQIKKSHKIFNSF